MSDFIDIPVSQYRKDHEEKGPEGTGSVPENQGMISQKEGESSEAAENAAMAVHPMKVGSPEGDAHVTEAGSSRACAYATEAGSSRDGACATDAGSFTEGQTVDLTYILRQMEAIQKDTKYLSEVIDKLSMMADGESGERYSPGNVMGVAKATALGDVVRCRETTNQQMLKVYEKMYEDISAKTSERQKAYKLVECVIDRGGISSEDKRMMISDILKHMV